MIPHVYRLSLGMMAQTVIQSQRWMMDIAMRRCVMACDITLYLIDWFSGVRRDALVK